METGNDTIATYLLKHKTSNIFRETMWYYMRVREKEKKWHNSLCTLKFSARNSKCGTIKVLSEVVGTDRGEIEHE